MEIVGHRYQNLFGRVYACQIKTCDDRPFEDGTTTRPVGTYAYTTWSWRMYNVHLSQNNHLPCHDGCATMRVFDFCLPNHPTKSAYQFCDVIAEFVDPNKHNLVGIFFNTQQQLAIVCKKPSLFAEKEEESIAKEITSCTGTSELAKETAASTPMNEEKQTQSMTLTEMVVALEVKVSAWQNVISEQAALIKEMNERTIQMAKALERL